MARVRGGGRLAALLERGQRDSELRSFDAESVAHIILRCKDGVLDALRHDPDQNVEEQIGTLLDFIDHAIGKRKGRGDVAQPSVRTRTLKLVGFTVLMLLVTGLLLLSRQVHPRDERLLLGFTIHFMLDVVILSFMFDGA